MIYTTRRVKLAAFLLLATLSTLRQTPAWAQAPVTGAADPEALFTSRDPKLNANKQVVLHIVRDLLEAGHWSDAPRYLTPRYIQHNPNVASGLEPVLRFFSAMPERPVPDRKSWRTKVVSVVAEGDLVMVATVRELPHPFQKGKTYTTTWFDIWRIQDGKADEHWDGATIAAPSAVVRPPSILERGECLKRRVQTTVVARVCFHLSSPLSRIEGGAGGGSQA